MRTKRKTNIVALALVWLMLFALIPQRVMASQISTEEKQTVIEEKSGYQQLIGVEDTTVKPSEVLDSGIGLQTYETSIWDSYSSRYFYNKMNSNQKEFYDNLYSVCNAFLVGDANAEYTGSTPRTAIASYGALSFDEAKNIYIIFQLNNPQFYFINHLYVFGGGGMAAGVYSDFANGITRTQYTTRFKNTIDSWIAVIKQQPDMLSMEKKAHDIVAENTLYESGNYHQSSAGVVLEGEAVCAGYAETYALLANAVGIETITVTSDSHEWCKSKLFGRWYAVDPTWDDQDYKTIYTFYNKSDETMEKAGAHTLESFWSDFGVPIACYDTVNTTPAIDTIISYVYNGIDYTAVFDADYYLTENADIRNAFGDDANKAFAHFVNYGMAEGRQGISGFDVYSYRAQNKDIRMIYGNDLPLYYLHYINYGKAEGRKATGTTTITDGITVLNGVDYSAVYNYSYYIRNNGDIAKVFANDDVSTLMHFVNCGMAEGRQAIDSFNVYSYRAQNGDVRNVYGSNLKAYYLHYMLYGKDEGRKATGTTTITNGITVYNGVDYSDVYNYTYYTSKYGDIKNVYANDDIATLRHFVNYGMAEGRQGNANFDVMSYYLQYADLRNVYGSNLTSYYLHYMSFGKNEGRKGTGTSTLQGATTVYNGIDYALVYDFDYYISNNADLERVFGNDDVAALGHFVNYGMAEGRQAIASFKVRTYQTKYEDLKSAFGNSLISYYYHYMNYGKAEGRTAQ